MINKDTYKRITEEEFDCTHCIERECTTPDNLCQYRLYCEAYNRLAELEDKIENGTLVELPSVWLDTLKLLTCASICYTKIKDLITSQMGQSKDIADLFFECPTVQGTVNDFALKDLGEANIECNKIVGFEEILNAMPHYKKIVEAKLKELQEGKK